MPTQIQDADVQTNAGILLSKLEAVTSAKVIVGSAVNVASQVSMSGDVTISNTGVTTLKNTGPGVTSATLASITIDAQGRVTALSNGTASATLTVATKTANYVMLNTDDVILVNGADQTNINITMQSAATAASKFFSVKNIGKGPVTILPNASDTFDGDTSIILVPGGTPQEAIQLVSNGGTLWSIF